MYGVEISTNGITFIPSIVTIGQTNKTLQQVETNKGSFMTTNSSPRQEMKLAKKLQTGPSLVIHFNKVSGDFQFDMSNQPFVTKAQSTNAQSITGSHYTTQRLVTYIYIKHVDGFVESCQLKAVTCHGGSSGTVCWSHSSGSVCWSHSSGTVCWSHSS